MNNGQLTEPVVLQITSDVRNLAGLREFVKNTGILYGCKQEALDDVILAINEAVTNIIVHGYDGHIDKILIELSLLDDDLIIHVRDWAPFFDPTQVPDPDINVPLEERDYGGMGVYMIRKLVDKFTYKRDGVDGSNEIILVKEDVV